jgi:hypothetical protein
MTVADADMFDETEDLGVPRHGQADIGHGQDGGHSGVRRRPVREHQVRLDRERGPRAIVSRRLLRSERVRPPASGAPVGVAGAERRVSRPSSGGAPLFSARRNGNPSLQPAGQLVRVPLGGVGEGRGGNPRLIDGSTGAGRRVESGHPAAETSG